MAIVILNSDNVNLGHIIRKNPNSAKHKVFAASTISGKAYGWYTSNEGVTNPQEYVCKFNSESEKINPDTFEHVRGNAGSQPYCFNQLLAKVFQWTVNNNNKDDVVGVQRIKIVGIRPNGGVNSLLLSPLVKDLEEDYSADGLVDLEITFESSVKQAIQIAQLAVLMYNGTIPNGYEGIVRIAKLMAIAKLPHPAALKAITSLTPHSHEVTYFETVYESRTVPKRISKGVTSEDLLNKLREDCELELSKGNIDPMMTGFVSEFNKCKLPMVTKYSCQGYHPDHEASRRCHVSFMYLPAYESEVLKLLRLVIAHVNDGGVLRPNLHPTVTFTTKFCHLDAGKSYDCVSISLPALASKQRDLCASFIDSLTEVLC